MTGGGWFHPVTREDYLSLPGVVAVEHGAEPGTAVLYVAPGCEGVARILTNAQVTIIGLRLEERVVGMTAAKLDEPTLEDGFKAAACPTCLAAPGEGCVTKRGAATGTHKARRR